MRALSLWTMFAALLALALAAGCAEDDSDNGDDDVGGLPQIDDDDDNDDNDNDDNDTADDDTVDDDTTDDDTTDDDTTDDDDDDNDDNDDDTFGVVAFTQFYADYMGLSKAAAPLGEVTKLVDVADHMAMYPAFSPDGQTIAFGANLHDPDPPLGFATMLYTMPTAGGDPVRLTDEDYLDVTENTPIYSPDGLTIAYVRSSQSQAPNQVDRVWLMDADGSNRRALNSDTDSYNDWNPAFSLDGKWLVFVSDRDTWCAEAYLADLSEDPATITRLTYTNCSPVQGASHPFFDATSDWVYFEAANADSYGLYRIATTGGDAELRWDIGYSNDGPYAGMASYSQFRPTEDRLSMVATGAHDSTDRIYVFETIDPVSDPVAVTATDLDAVDPAWWRPAK